MKPLVWMGVVCLVASCLLSFTWATTVRVVNLLEMVELSDRVFWGRCLSTSSQWDPQLQMAVDSYRFEVLHGIKGAATGDVITFRQLQGLQPGQSSLPGLPSYAKGEEVLLFLHGDSRLELTSPVGMAQGIFHKHLTQAGTPAFINGLQNRNLSYGLTVEAVGPAGVTVEELRTLQEKGPLTLDLLESIVHKIEEYQGQSRRWLQ